jgi:uncharacterized protein (DUF1697 family)
MKTYAIFLRGVMPSGKNSLKMADLRAALTAAGLAGVQTYIQSGNAVAQSALGQAKLEALVQGTIASEIGPDLTVVVRTPLQLARILERNPFAAQAAQQDSVLQQDTARAKSQDAKQDAKQDSVQATTQDTAQQYFSLLASAPETSAVQALQQTDFSPDMVQLDGDTIYALYATRYSDSKFNNSYFERKLKVAVTTRNFNTMTKMLAMARALEAGA